MTNQHTSGPWTYEYGAVYAGESGRIALADRENPKTAPTERDSNMRLCAAAPLGYELAEALLAQEQDGLDRSEWILEKAREFMRAAEGEQK